MASAAMAYAARLGRVSHRFVQQEQVFQPKDTIAIKIGCETVSMYPRLAADAEDAEKSHAFHVNIQALDCASVMPKTKLIFFAEHMGIGSYCQALIAEVKDDFAGRCFNPTNMTLISYRSASGAVVPNTQVVGGADDGQLKPVQNGAAQDCRPALIKYCTVSTEVIFPNLKRQVFTQTFELPMEDRAVTH